MGFVKGAVLAAAVVFGLISFSGAEASPVTPLSLTQNGLTAMFTAAPNPNGFEVSSVIHFSSLHGKTLIELHDANNMLAIGFSQPLVGLTLNFALDTPAPANLDFQLYSGGLGGTLVGSGAAIGSNVPGFFSVEGTLVALGPPNFDTIILTAPTVDAFAIDNVQAITASPRALYLYTFDAPEPLTLALFGAGLAGAGALRRHQRPL